MRAIRLLTAGAALIAASFPTPVDAQTTSGLNVTTPFPAVAVAPGDVVTFSIDVAAPDGDRVELAVTEIPEGWGALLRGGGFVIDGVYADAESPPNVTLEVTVPEGAQPGLHRIVIRGTSPAGSDELELDLRVSRVETGQVSLTAEFPSLQGPAGATYRFDLQLTNDTPRETVFDLEGAGPPGWQVTVRPSGEELASSVEVGPGQSSGLIVEVNPADQAAAGAYPIGVRASGAGMSAEAELAVRIIGNYGISVSTPDERLNADVQAGDPTEVPIIVINEGSTPLREVDLQATSPSGWTVEFRADTIAEIPPGETARAVAVVTPAEDAVAGDYIVTITASTPETTDQMDLRTTVRTSALWGVVGGGLIVAAIGGLAILFRRFGRR